MLTNCAICLMLSCKSFGNFSALRIWIRSHVWWNKKPRTLGTTRITVDQSRLATKIHPTGFGTYSIWLKANRHTPLHREACPCILFILNQLNSSSTTLILIQNCEIRVMHKIYRLAEKYFALQPLITTCEVIITYHITVWVDLYAKGN